MLQLFSHFIPSLITLHTKNSPSLKVVAGSFTAGFRDMFSVYILEALANIDHGYVYLFILFMAGLVGLIEKSGGLAGVTIALRRYVKTPF